MPGTADIMSWRKPIGQRTAHTDCTSSNGLRHNAPSARMCDAATRRAVPTTRASLPWSSTARSVATASIRSCRERGRQGVRGGHELLPWLVVAWCASPARPRCRFARRRGHLPASSTKLLHMAHLQHDETRNDFTVSLADRCRAVDPVASVLGKLQAKASSTQLHVRLTDAALGALQRLTLHPTAKPCQPEPEFTDRSFTKACMPAQVITFCRGLERDFWEAGMPFVIALCLARRPSLLHRIPALLFAIFGNLPGYRFSQAVYRQQLVCLPSKASSAQDLGDSAQ